MFESQDMFDHTFHLATLLTVIVNYKQGKFAYFLNTVLNV